MSLCPFSSGTRKTGLQFGPQLCCVSPLWCFNEAWLARRLTAIWLTLPPAASQIGDEDETLTHVFCLCQVSGYWGPCTRRFDIHKQTLCDSEHAIRIESSCKEDDAQIETQIIRMLKWISVIHIEANNSCPSIREIKIEVNERRTVMWL